MNDNEASVRIVADASGVQHGVDAAKTDLGELGPFLQQLNAQFADLAATIKASLAQSTAEVSEMASEMKVLEKETEAETLSLRSLALSAKEGAESIEGMKAAVFGFAEVFMAAFAVERIAEWAKEFAEASEKIQHLSQTFGMTTAQVQGLNAVALTTGISLDTITRGMQVLDKNAVQAAQGNSAVATAFKAVGISANDGSTQMQRLMTIADKFKQMDDGPKKVALAMELLGRSGAQLIPVLNLGSEGLAEIAAKAKEYDVAQTAVSDSAQSKGMALAESINEGKLAWQGLTNVLGDAFGPILKEIVDSIDNVIAAMIESYNQGGIVAEVFEAIKVVVEGVGVVINALAAIFAAVWDAISDFATAMSTAFTDLFGVKIPGGVKRGEVALAEFKDAIELLKDGWLAVIQTIEAALLMLVTAIQTAAKMAWDAMHLNWSAVAADWHNGFGQIEKEGQAWAAKMHALASDVGNTVALALQGKAAAPSGGGLAEGKGGAGGDFNPTLGSTPKEKKPKDDLVQQLEAQLTARKLVWDEAQDQQDTAQQFSLESEKAFWAAALAQTNLSAKDRAEIEQKYLEVSQKLRQQQITGQLEIYKQDEEAAGKNADVKLAVVQQETAYVGRMYGQQSDQYKAALAREIAAAKGVEAQKLELAKVTADGVAKLNAMKVADEEADDKFLVEMGRKSKEQQLASERRYQTELYQADMQGLQQRLALMKADPNHDPIAYQKLLNDIAQKERAFQATITSIDRQGMLARRQIGTQFAQSFSTDISKMLVAQEAFSTGLNNMWKSLGNIVSTAVAHMVEAFIAGLVAQDAASGMQHAKEMLRHAEEAAAGAWKAVVGIPVVGPVLAPIAAAAAFAGVMAFSSAEGGDWQVKPGMYELHRDEMVLPAWAATPLRSMVSGGGGSPAGGFGAPSGSGGDVHVHFHGAVFDSKRTVEKFLMDHKSGVHAAVRAHVRAGGALRPA